jgi:hypothetical protein
MKKLLIAMILATMSLMATDYSQMTMEELNALRGTLPIEERDAFRAEMQSRIQAMTPEEQAAFRASRQASQGQNLRDGSGAGNMQKGSGSNGQKLQDGSGLGSKAQGANGNRKGTK